MTDQLEPEFIFTDMNPKDGFHVKRVGPDYYGLALYMGVYAGGELCNLMSVAPEDAAIELRRWDEPDERAVGACNRLELVMDAVARYFTTGGNWSEFSLAVDRARRVVVGGLEFPGYYYKEGYSTVDPYGHQHFFVKEDDPGQLILWDEPDGDDLTGGFISPKTRAEVKQELGESEEESEDDPAEEIVEPLGPEAAGGFDVFDRPGEVPKGLPGGSDGV